MNERLRNVIDECVKQGLVTSDADFARKIGLSKGTLSANISGIRKLSANSVKRITETFPGINPRYLTDESCAVMLKDSPFSNNVNNGRDQVVGDASALTAVIQKQQEQIDRLLTIIEKLSVR